MSKYKASWKEFDLNKDFWTEVLVGRKVESLGVGEKNVKIGGNPLAFLIEMLLDSGERVWFSEKMDIPQTEDIVGRTITKLEWCDSGISTISLSNGITILLPKNSWRICIQDD